MALRIHDSLKSRKARSRERVFFLCGASVVADALSAVTDRLTVNLRFPIGDLRLPSPQPLSQRERGNRYYAVGDR